MHLKLIATKFVNILFMLSQSKQEKNKLAIQLSLHLVSQLYQFFRCWLVISFFTLPINCFYPRLHPNAFYIVHCSLSIKKCWTMQGTKKRRKVSIDHAQCLKKHVDLRDRFSKFWAKFKYHVHLTVFARVV